MEAAAARLTDRILTVSPTEYSKAQRYHIAYPPKLVNIGQGVDPEFYSRDAANDVESTERVAYYRDLLRTRPVVGSVARLVPEKGIDCLLEATAICKVTYPDIAILILGDGPERHDLEQQGEQLGISQNVFFVDFIRDFRKVTQFYSLMHMFVLPTHWESFGVVFTEAMSMELPVIEYQD